MAAIATKPNPNRILRDLEQLPFHALDKLLPKIAAIRASKHPLVMTGREALLQKKVESGLPEPLWTSYTRLIQKRQDNGLTARERARLESIIDRIESFKVDWLRAASELAEIRGQTLDRLLKSLDIRRPDYA